MKTDNKNEFKMEDMGILTDKNTVTWLSFLVL